MAKESTIKLYYVGRLKDVHAGVGGVKYHFTAATGFAADVKESHARTLLRTGNYMPAGTDAARQASERAARLAPAKPADTATPEGDAQPNDGGGKSRREPKPRKYA